jgi:hypothetical protein
MRVFGLLIDDARSLLSHQKTEGHSLN